jgi:hypothetical protein
MTSATTAEWAQVQLSEHPHKYATACVQSRKRVSSLVCDPGKRVRVGDLRFIRDG